MDTAVADRDDLPTEREDHNHKREGHFSALNLRKTNGIESFMGSDAFDDLFTLAPAGLQPWSFTNSILGYGSFRLAAKARANPPVGPRTSGGASLLLLEMR